MKPLLPTLKEKRRYIFVISKKENFEKNLFNKFLELFGKIGLSKADLKIVKSVKNKSSEKNKGYTFIGILKVNAKYLKHLLGTLTFLEAQTIYVSGTLNKLRQKIKEHPIGNKYYNELKKVEEKGTKNESRVKGKKSTPNESNL